MLETLVRHLDMVRLTVATSALALAGCTGLIDGGSPSKAEIARQLWTDKALPALTAGTCVTCHNGSRANVGFLAGTDDIAVRQTLMTFDPPALNLDAPQSSRLITKGAHDGPPLDGGQRSDVQEWIQAEKEAAADVPGGPNSNDIRTQDFLPARCTQGLPGTADCPINELPLDDLGNGVSIPGAKITFVMQAVGSGIYLNNLKLIPGAMGAYIEHPLFVSVPTDPKAKPVADTFDRFFNVKMNLMTGAGAPEQQLGGGTAAFVNFPPGDKIAIFFKAAKVFQADGPGGGTGPTGCKVPTQFETAARAQLNTNCGNCHRGQNGGATSALDMTGVDQPNAMNACNQVRLRVNLDDINQSGIFLATTPGNANHPFTFGGNATTFNAFKAALTPWINAEKTAP
ncbi:MAG TPA: hypothetical protein VN253_16055 [Kofleriaceae bacterium]|nr:hypothetical protein [Kofleriaceae bacterium]